MILDKAVFLNKSCVVPHTKIKEGDKIEIPGFEKRRNIELLPKPERMDLNILYEDEDIIVVDKPAGLVTHPASPNMNGTLVNGLLYQCKKLSSVNLPLRPGIVHRLDKGTSGVMVAAKSDLAHKFLARVFSKHSIKRRYIAIVKGNLKFDENIIEAPIGRHPRHRTRMTVTYNKSRSASTYYKVVSRNKEYSVAEVYPKTGRTHQIRVHFSYIGYPVLGDKEYGGESELIDRPALHAEYLEFIHPVTKKLVGFRSEIPEDMKKVIEMTED